MMTIIRHRVTEQYLFILLFCALTRCKVDSTVEIYSPAHERQFQFSMEAFKFIGLHDQVKNGVCG